MKKKGGGHVSISDRNVLITTKWSLGNEDSTQAHEIRLKVFVNEQNIPLEVEQDDKDLISQLVVVYESDKPVATGRFYIENGLCTIGRIAVLKEYRGNGFGDLVVKMLLDKSLNAGANSVFVHAQKQAIGFYEKMGFKSQGNTYIDKLTNKEYVDMTYDYCVKPSSSCCSGKK